MKTNINFQKASFKDFENIPDLNAFQRAEVFREFTNYMEENGQMNFRFMTSKNGCGPEMWVTSPFNKTPKKCVSLVSNDYLYIMEMLTTLFRAKLTTGLADFWVTANAIKACTKIVI